MEDNKRGKCNKKLCEKNEVIWSAVKDAATRRRKEWIRFIEAALNELEKN